MKDKDGYPAGGKVAVSTTAMAYSTIKQRERMRDQKRQSRSDKSKAEMAKVLQKYGYAVKEG